MAGLSNIQALKLPVSALQIGSTSPEAQHLHALLQSGWTLSHASGFVDSTGTDTVLAILTAKQPEVGGGGGGGGPEPHPTPN